MRDPCHVRDSDNRPHVRGSVGWLWDFAQLWRCCSWSGPPNSHHHQPQQWGTPPGRSPFQHGRNLAVCYPTGIRWCGLPRQEKAVPRKAIGEGLQAWWSGWPIKVTCYRNSKCGELLQSFVKLWNFTHSNINITISQKHTRKQNRLLSLPTCDGITQDPTWMVVGGSWASMTPLSGRHIAKRCWPWTWWIKMQNMKSSLKFMLHHDYLGPVPTLI